MAEKKTVVLLSGGLDSVVLAHKLKKEKFSVRAITVNTGFLSNPYEIACAKAAALDLDIPIEVLSAPGLSDLVAGFYPPSVLPMIDWDKNRPVDPVPNSDYVSGFYILAAIATFYAQLLGASTVQVAVIKEQVVSRKGFHSFFSKWGEVVNSLNANSKVELVAPFAGMEKSEVVKLGKKLGVDFTKTWSCYGDGKFHCGVCAGCVSRKTAFIESKIKDSTTYEE